MRYAEASTALANLLEKSKVVYLYTDPEVLDFTSNRTNKVVIVGNGSVVDLHFDPEETPLIMGLLSASIFDKEKIENIVCWDIKSLISYALHHTKKIIEISAPIFDLKVIENFLGISQSKPTTLGEALRRLKSSMQNTYSWKSLYKTYHIPLATKVIPALETTPLLDLNARIPCYAHYSIEGQQNGRLLCSKQFEQGYLAHTLGAEQKAVLRPRGYNMSFVSADIRNCEVTVLQWLSNDKRLKAIIDSSKDLYRVIYQLITEDVCNTDNKRKMSQNMFLAIIYGAQARGLANSLGIPENVAAELRKRIIERFPVCWSWLQDFQEKASKGVVHDYFGRPRNFSEKPYLARNFAVQGVAATACLDKLIELNEQLKEPARTCFSIHDGYGFITPSSYAEELGKTVKEVLESPSRVCPGLHMRVKVETGQTLDQLTRLQV